MKRAIYGGLFLILIGWSAGARASDDPWAQWRFLVGDWVADAAPDQGTGSFSFAFDLDQKILVRRSQADYPARDGRQASHHQDLLIVHGERAGEPMRADYYDNEGHVIRYTVQAGKEGGPLTLVSDAATPGPRFRLAYEKQDDGGVKISFEIAMPGKPDEFKPYVGGVAHRKK